MPIKYQCPDLPQDGIIDYEDVLKAKAANCKETLVLREFPFLFDFAFEKVAREVENIFDEGSETTR